MLICAMSFAGKSIEPIHLILECPSWFFTSCDICCPAWRRLEAAFFMERFYSLAKGPNPDIPALSIYIPKELRKHLWKEVMINE